VEKEVRERVDAPSVAKRHPLVGGLHGQIGGIPPHDEGDQVAQHVHGICAQGGMGWTGERFQPRRTVARAERRRGPAGGGRSGRSTYQQ
jgi:hypothetical protein